MGAAEIGAIIVGDPVTSPWAGEGVDGAADVGGSVGNMVDGALDVGATETASIGDAVAGCNVVGAFVYCVTAGVCGGVTGTAVIGEVLLDVICSEEHLSVPL